MKQRVTENIVKTIALTVCSATLLCTTPALAAEDKTISGNDFGCYAASQQTGDLRYIALTKLEAKLNISSTGYASCTAHANLLLGYSCDVTLELQQKSGTSWKTIKEWASSGSTNSINEGCYVTSGHDYRLKLSADVHNSSGKLVESPTEYSTVVHY